MAPTLLTEEGVRTSDGPLAAGEDLATRVPKDCANPTARYVAETRRLWHRRLHAHLLPLQFDNGVREDMRRCALARFRVVDTNLIVAVRNCQLYKQHYMRCPEACCTAVIMIRLAFSIRRPAQRRDGWFLLECVNHPHFLPRQPSQMHLQISPQPSVSLSIAKTAHSF